MLVTSFYSYKFYVLFHSNSEEKYGKIGYTINLANGEVLNNSYLNGIFYNHYFNGFIVDNSIYDPSNHYIYIVAFSTSVGGSQIIVMNASNYQINDIIKLSNLNFYSFGVFISPAPTPITYDNENGNLYLAMTNNTGITYLVEINSENQSISEKALNIKNLGSISTIKYNTNNNLLYALNQTSLIVINPLNYSIIKTTLISNNNNQGEFTNMIFIGSNIYVSGLSNNLTLISDATNNITENITLSENVKIYITMTIGMVYNKQNGNIYLQVISENKDNMSTFIIVYNVTDHKIIKNIPTPFGIYYSMVYDPNTNTVWAIDAYSTFVNKNLSTDSWEDLQFSVSQNEIFEINSNNQIIQNFTTGYLIPGLYYSLNGLYNPVDKEVLVNNGLSSTISILGTSFPHIKQYKVTFTEQGLPNGTSWYIKLSNGVSLISRTTSINYYFINGTYSYTVSTTSKTYGPTVYSSSFTVSGKALTEPITFTRDKYLITFTETGLPPGTSWYVNLTNGMKSGPITTSSYPVSVTNGTYTYTVSTSDHIYSPASYTGTFTVNGKALTESITFKHAYEITFTETGLPSGTSWYVTLNGTTETSTTTITFNETNGTYTFTVGSISGYTSSPSSGSLIVNGTNVDKAITFTGVTTHQAPKWAFVGAYLNFTGKLPLPPTGKESIGFINITIISVNTANETIECREIIGNATSHFTEYTNTSWNDAVFALNSSTLSVLNSGVIPSYIKDNQTFNYVTEIKTGVDYSTPLGTFVTDELYNSNSSIYVDSSSGVLVSFSINTNVSLSLNLTATNIPMGHYYSISFTQSGLSSGTTWYVTFNGTNLSSSTSTISFSVPNGTYSFTVNSVSGYTSSPSSGSITVSGSSISKTITFTPVQVKVSKYTVTFTESGLPSGTTWYVNLTNGANSGPITTSSYTFLITNGSYTYTVSTGNKIYSPSPSSGSFTVNGTSVSESVTFSKVTYKVTFTESGLPSGTTWYVNITESNGTILYSHSITASSYPVSLTNGSYIYTVSTANKTYAPAVYSSSFTVNGKALTESITFKQAYEATFTESGLPSGTIWYVNLSNGANSGPITASSYTFLITNNTYTYTIVTTDTNYKPASTSSFAVNGKPVSESANFIQLYSITFTEKGLTSGTSWSVTLNGTKETSTTTTITFKEINGTYKYTVNNVSGYTSSPSNGSLTVNGSNNSKTITFTPVKKTSLIFGLPDMEFYAIIGIIIGIVAVAGIIIIKRR